MHISDAIIHRKRNLIGAILALGILAVVFGFVFRVVYFSSLIQTGQLDLTGGDFSSAFTPAVSRIASAVNNQLVDVVTDDDPSLGSRDAKITIVEFADFGCPYSRDASFTMRELARAYPDRFLYVYRDFPITELHPLANEAALASGCAKAQGKFWEYHDKLYQYQTSLTEESFLLFAESLNLNTTAFQSCMNNDTFQEEVEEDYRAGAVAGVEGTPTFFVNGVKIDGAIPKSFFEQIFETVKKAESYE